MKFTQEPICPEPIDQRPIERRDDVLVYMSAPLEADVGVSGLLEVVRYAASSAKTLTFTAKLVDVDPDGRAIHLSQGIVRARHTAGAWKRSSSWSRTKWPSTTSRWPPGATRF